MAKPLLEWFGTFEAEQAFHERACYVLMGSFIAVFFALTIGGQTAPYGRYSSASWGPRVHGKLGWIDHSSSLIVAVVLYLYYGESACTASPVNCWLLFLFSAHYVNRSFIFGMRVRDPKPIPLFILSQTFGFTLFNGWLQARHLTAFHAHPASDLWSPHFLLGNCLFFAGAYINISSDGILRDLRKTDDPPGTYKIPMGGMFTYVSGANFFGEIIEWTGFAIACNSLPGAAFAVATFCNIGPRGWSHHQWYLNKFKDKYPRSRKAVIPFVW